MIKSRPGVGDVVRLNSACDRRSFLRGLATAGLSLAGLRAAVERVTGAEPDGVPVVRTIRGPGEPTSVVVVHESDYEALAAFHAVDFADKLTEPVHSVRLHRASSTPGDVRIHARVDGKPTGAARRNPKRLLGIPLEFERAARIEARAGSAASTATEPCCDSPPELRAGVRINSGRDRDKTGTIGLIADDESDDDDPLIVTAKHVVTEQYNDPGGEPADSIEHDTKTVGELERDSDGDPKHDYPEHDAIAYRHNGTGEAHTQEIKGDLDPIRDRWTYDGLWEAVGTYDGGGRHGQLPTEYYGQKTGRGSTETAMVEKSKSMNGGDFKYVAQMNSDPTENGDSGCPFVTTDDQYHDEDGYAAEGNHLVGILHGGSTGNGDPWVMIPAAPNHDGAWFGGMDLDLW